MSEGSAIGWWRMRDGNIAEVRWWRLRNGNIAEVIKETTHAIWEGEIYDITGIKLRSRHLWDNRLNSLEQIGWDLIERKRGEEKSWPKFTTRAVGDVGKPEPMQSS